MIMALLLLTLVPFLALSYVSESLEELLIGVWKHRQDEVILIFAIDGHMICKIPFIQGFCEIPGTYELMDQSRLKIRLSPQYGSLSGEPIFTIPRAFQVSIRENNLILHDLKTSQSAKHEFVRIK